ncbi:uncharacterized protein LOC119594855 [Penaeus monodon]|uniref:uncharacterized protein LOC119594855 n=1 Tax=Penaeus monodon TaxID=6687 RepID=UPI0018A74845|nr:uncharacterized protein LOC119594855 [Penaeus monodon]
MTCCGLHTLIPFGDQYAMGPLRALFLLLGLLRPARFVAGTGEDWWYATSVAEEIVAAGQTVEYAQVPLVTCAAYAGHSGWAQLFCHMDGLCVLSEQAVVRDNSTGSGVLMPCWTKYSPSSCFPPFEDAGAAGCFYLHGSKMTWFDGRDHCKSLGADLAVPTNFDAFRSYAASAGLPQDVWLGIYDQEWLNGSRVARALWAKGNPDGPPQDCGRKYYSVLADAKCSENWYFLCEIK